MRTLTSLITAALLATGLAAGVASDPARERPQTDPATQLVANSITPRTTAYARALTQKGDPYRYGGNGPGFWDCSGLTYWAYKHDIPRTSGAQRRSSRTVHVSRYKARRGDLVFWGYGHVELLSKVYKKNGVWYTQTFGAHHSGTRVGYRTVRGVPHIEHVNGAG